MTHEQFKKLTHDLEELTAAAVGASPEVHEALMHEIKAICEQLRDAVIEDV